MTMQALNQYLEDVCVYFYWRKKELLNLNELDQWHEMNEKQKSVENDIADMKRIYEESKHIAKPYEEYFRYHMHEIARLHLLSIQIREELLSTGVSSRTEKKKLNDMKRRAEKALRLSAPVESSDVVEKRHTDGERLRPEKCSRFALVTAAEGSMGMNENRVTTLRGELKQKREEANVLRENFDRKLHSDGGCGVNSEHGEQDFLTSAENSVLEQIKAHESYIKQTSDHIAYLDQLQIDQTSIDSHSNLLVQSLPSPSSQYDATKSTSVTTSIETPTSALLSDVNEVINGRSRSCDDDSMNDVMLTSQSSTLVPESDYASEIEHRKTSFEEHPKSEGAIHHQQDVDATPMKSPHSSVHVQEPVNEMRMSPGEISSAAFRPDVVKMNQHEHMVDANLSVDGTSDESCDISEYNLSQLDETVNTRSVMESFEKLHISAHNDAQKEESHIEHVNSVGLDEAAAFSEGTSKPSQIFHDQASIDQELSPNDHSSPFVLKDSDMQSVKNESHEDNNYSPELSTKMESFVPRLNLDELDTKDLPPEQLRFEQEEGEPLIADNEEQERSEQDEKRTSEEISAHSESKIIEKETTHPDALAPSSKNLPERETSPVDESETDDKSLVLHLPDKDQLIETNNSCEEILGEVPSAVEEYDATVCSDEVEDERVVENNASKVDGNAQSETSEDADSECFFTDAASSHQVSLGSSQDFASMKPQDILNEDDISAGDINSSVLNNTSKRNTPKRFALTVSPLNVASPRSPLATRFATVMPSPSRNRSPRSLNSTPRSPRVTSGRVVSSLGKLLLDQSLNDSLLTMLTAMNEKKRSVAEEEFENSVSFQEQNSAENVLSEISRTDQERIGPQSPPDLLDFTPLDLSGVYSNDESNKLSDMDSIHRVTEEKQRLVGIPDLTCDTPVPKKTQSKTLASVEESNKKYYRDDRDQICSLIREYAGCIWQQFTNGETLCIDATCNKDENEHAASIAYKQMIADECCAVVSRAFARDVRNIWMNHGAAVPPRSQLELENILRDNILNVLCPDCSKPRVKTRWETVCRDAAIKSSAESYYLTKAVMDEVYRDEDRWCDFESTEENIKETLAEEIFTDQISESFSVMANGSVIALK
ncbi:unnamed protein product [Anisakis simplex]|uniref:SH3 domain-containing protein n=1 Tax=Anisakis simplex TaxID=6269 RepID=A0A158PPI2_ANISI|nr:unnamed protein product [Anisakis simplex]